MKNLRKMMAWALLLIFPLNTYTQNTERRDAGDFHSISVTGKIRVELYPSGERFIEVIAGGTEAVNVITEIREKELAIRLKPNTPKEADIKVKVYFTGVDMLSVQAKGLIVCPDTLRAESMIFNARSGGKMELWMNLGSLEATVTQGGILVFSGQVEDQEISVASGATYSAFRLEAHETRVKAVTGGKAKVTASEAIHANANTGGYIGYRGDPGKTSVKTSLGGEIVHEGTR